MVEAPSILIVAVSGRALAAAARRAGYRVVAADLFGDTDLKSAAEDYLTVEGDLVSGFDPESLITAADFLAPQAFPPSVGFVYGAGLEARSDLLERLCRGRRLYGNRPQTVARLKDPAEFFGALDRLGVPHPNFCLALPEAGEHWLVKSIGGSGGAHVRRFTGSQVGRDGYYQRVVSGRPVGVSFLADGRRSLPIGFNEQWHATGDGAQPYRFSGALQPASIGDRLRRDVQTLLDAIVAEFGLVGLNSLDVMDDGGSYAVLEVNPRPGANLDVFDRAADSGLFAHHIAACEGRLPDSWAAPPLATAIAIVYADRPARVPADIDWPEWVADRPAAGAQIAEGAPVCTVLTAGETTAAVRHLTMERVSQVLSILQADEPQSAVKGSQPVIAEASHA